MDDGEVWIIQIIVRLIFAGACAAIASSKGRNTVGWFFLGLLFTCIPLIIILCLSNLKEEAAKWSANEIEQRRLREQLRQEQMKNEALRQHTIARLDAHDEELGVDTRQAAPALTMGGQPQPVKLITGAIPPGAVPGQVAPPAGDGTPPPGLPADNWYTAEGGEQEGPFTYALLHARARQGTLPPETLVWAEGMPEWIPARDVQGLIS